MFTTTLGVDIPLGLRPCKILSTPGIWIWWTGTLEWNGGMDWTGMEWNGRDKLGCVQPLTFKLRCSCPLEQAEKETTGCFRLLYFICQQQRSMSIDTF